MTRARWLIAGFWLITFWLLAGMVVAPALQHRLADAANQQIKALPTGYSPPQVEFDGQRAILRGQVRTERQRAALVSTLRHQVRSSGPLAAKLNPVQLVIDQMKTVPYPPGWMLLAANGTRSQLIGAAATDQESRDLSALLQDRWSQHGGRVESRLTAAPAIHDEAPDLKATLATLPKPRKEAGGDSAQIQITRIGSTWQRLLPDATDERLHEQTLALGIGQQDWEKSILPLIQSVRRYQKDERTRLAEAEHQAKLPPPHVFLAARDTRLLARGELATLGLKRELLNALIAAFPNRRVIDDLRVNPQRRAVADFGPITAALIPSESDQDPKTKGKSLVIGLSSAAWQPVDWQVGGDAQPWKKDLPADLPPALLQSDHRMVTEWLQGKASGIPALPIRAQPSFLTLTLLPDKVILAGQLAEESLRTQLVEAARQKYAGQALVIAEALLVRGTCEPSSDIQQSLRSLPALPDSASPGSIAFAKPGHVWKSTPATQGIDQPGAVTKSGILPTDFPSAMAEDTFWDGFDHLRHHWKTLANEAKKEAAP